MRERVGAAFVAGGLVVGAGLATVMTSGSSVAFAQEDPAQEETSERFHERGAVLEEVLDDLVEAGTITREQADSVAEALVAKAQEHAAERRETRQLIEEFLDDEVISEDELARLPEEHPFNDENGPFAEALEDGELSRDEIQESRPHFRRDLFKKGARFGALLDEGGIDQGEYDALPDDHPLKSADLSEIVSGYLEDGVITIDELRAIKMSQKDSGDAA
jgi:polyhydroxyalkanoate synthesis regulator phasin